MTRLVVDLHSHMGTLQGVVLNDERIGEIVQQVARGWRGRLVLRRPGFPEAEPAGRTAEACALAVAAAHLELLDLAAALGFEPVPAPWIAQERGRV